MIFIFVTMACPGGLLFGILADFSDPSPAPSLQTTEKTPFIMKQTLYLLLNGEDYFDRRLLKEVLLCRNH